MIVVLISLLFLRSHFLEDFYAQEALQMGFVSRVSETDDDIIGAASEICRKIIQNSPIAVAVTKSSLNYSRDHTVRDGLEHIALQNSSALMSEDFRKSFIMIGGATDVQFSPLKSHSRL